MKNESFAFRRVVRHTRSELLDAYHQVKPWQKSQGEHKPWKKTEGEALPWKKAEGEFKPWSKSNERPQKSRFNPSTSLGMVRGNGERSRTKARGLLRIDTERHIFTSRPEGRSFTGLGERKEVHLARL